MTNEFIINHQTKTIMAAIKQTPGKLFLGNAKPAINTLINHPRGEDQIRKIFRNLILRKFNEKWGS